MKKSHGERTLQTIAAAAAAKSLQSCPTLCDPIDGSPPGSTIRGILQARTLEWVAISFSTNYRVVANYTLYGTMDWFKFGKGVRQGCIWSPCLFYLYAHYNMEIPGSMNHKLELRLPGSVPVQLLSCVQLFATHGLMLSWSSPTPGACSNSCPLSPWCHPTTSSSVDPFSSHLESFPASWSFPVSPFFTSDGQTVGVSASASVLAMNIHNIFPIGSTGWISLQSKGLSRVFANTTVQKHQFFSAQLFL